MPVPGPIGIVYVVGRRFRRCPNDTGQRVYNVPDLPKDNASLSWSAKWCKSAWKPSKLSRHCQVSGRFQP